jgi:hypothetical protein
LHQKLNQISNILYSDQLIYGLYVCTCVFLLHQESFDIIMVNNPSFYNGGVATASSREGSFSFPISQRRSMGTTPAPLAIAPWSEDALTPQTMVIDSPWTIAPWPDTKLPLERQHSFQKGQQACAHTQKADVELIPQGKPKRRKAMTFHDRCRDRA